MHALSVSWIQQQATSLRTLITACLEAAWPNASETELPGLLSVIDEALREGRIPSSAMATARDDVLDPIQERDLSNWVKGEAKWAKQMTKTVLQLDLGKLGEL